MTTAVHNIQHTLNTMQGNTNASFNGMHVNYVNIHNSQVDFGQQLAAVHNNQVDFGQQLAAIHTEVFESGRRAWVNEEAAGIRVSSTRSTIPRRG